MWLVSQESLCLRTLNPDYSTNKRHLVFYFKCQLCMNTKKEMRGAKSPWDREKKILKKVQNNPNSKEYNLRFWFGLAGFI